MHLFLPPPSGVSPTSSTLAFSQQKDFLGVLFLFPTQNSRTPNTCRGSTATADGRRERCCADYLRFSLRFFPLPSSPSTPPSPRSACSGSRANPRVRSPAARQRLLGVVRQRRRRLRPSPASADGARKAAAPAVLPQAEPRRGAPARAGARTHKTPSRRPTRPGAHAHRHTQVRGSRGWTAASASQGDDYLTPDLSTFLSPLADWQPGAGDSREAGSQASDRARLRPGLLQSLW